MLKLNKVQTEVIKKLMDDSKEYKRDSVEKAASVKIGNYAVVTWNTVHERENQKPLRKFCMALVGRNGGIRKFTEEGRWERASLNDASAA